MTGKHTPGPWVIRFRRDGSSYICMGRTEPGHQHKQFNLALEYGNENDNADAHLIAAAPDLLEALEALRHAVCGETGFAACVRKDSGRAYPWPALDEAEAIVEAAISKARGQE